MSYSVTTKTNDQVCWLVEINTPRPSAPVTAPMPEVPAFGAVMEVEVPQAIISDAPTLRYSDRGWIGEPNDVVMPNVRYDGRLISPPVFAREIPIYPDETRRTVYNEAVIELLNQDNALAFIEGNWKLGGCTAKILRGPHRTPYAAYYSEFVQIAEMRVTSAPTGDGRLEMSFSSIAADLSGPACNTYAGTGGMDGAEANKGDNKPRVLGVVLNVEPVLIHPGLLILQFNDGPMQAVMALRDKGIPLTYAGDVLTYAQLVGASVAAGTFKTCLSTGHVRVGASFTQLTGDVQGDTSQGGYSALPAQLAVKILRTMGGILAPRASASSFASWPQIECGFVIREGTVADAMETLARGIFAYWGSDTFGNFTGGVVTPPENSIPVALLDERTIIGRPSGVSGLQPPWWRSLVEYQRLDRVQEASALAGDPNNPADRISPTMREFWGKQARVGDATDLTLRQRFPLSVEGTQLPGVINSAADASAVAQRILSVCGVERSSWAVRLSSADNLSTLTPGTCVRLVWPSIPSLAQGRNFIIKSVDGNGERPEIVLWG